MPPSACVDLEPGERRTLLHIARQAIENGACGERAERVACGDLGRRLLQPAAVFVTLTRDGALRGCVGSLEAREPLAQAVADAAFSAAFADRRFAPAERAEIGALRIEISVLSEPRRIEADSRQALCDLLEPGIDGLIVEDRGCRATFLPKVWEKMNSADEFLEHLFMKAGLRSDHWSSSLCLRRYRTLSFAEE